MKKTKHKRSGPSIKYKADGGCVRKSISLPLNIWEKVESIATETSQSISAVIVAMIKKNL